MTEKMTKEDIAWEIAELIYDEDPTVESTTVDNAVEIYGNDLPTEMRDDELVGLIDSAIAELKTEDENNEY